MPSSREEQQRTRRRVDSSVSAACTSSPQPRCSPAFTCLPFARFPYPNVGERALDPHCGDHLNINRFPTAFPTAPTRRRLDRHAAWNSIATSQADCSSSSVYGDFFQRATARQSFVVLVLAFLLYTVSTWVLWRQIG